MLMPEKIFIPISPTSSRNQLSYVVHCFAMSNRCSIFIFPQLFQENALFPGIIHQERTSTELSLVVLYMSVCRIFCHFLGVHVFQNIYLLNEVECFTRAYSANLPVHFSSGSITSALYAYLGRKKV